MRMLHEAKQQDHQNWLKDEEHVLFNGDVEDGAQDGAGWVCPAAMVDDELVSVSVLACIHSGEHWL